jgi:hypothetical protein
VHECTNGYDRYQVGGEIRPVSAGVHLYHPGLLLPLQLDFLKKKYSAWLFKFNAEDRIHFG